MPTFSVALLTPWSLLLAADTALHLKNEDSGTLKIIQPLHHLCFLMYSMLLVQFKGQLFANLEDSYSTEAGTFPDPLLPPATQCPQPPSPLWDTHRAHQVPHKHALQYGSKSTAPHQLPQAGRVTHHSIILPVSMGNNTHSCKRHLALAEAVSGWADWWSGTSCSRHRSNSSQCQTSKLNSTGGTKPDKLLRISLSSKQAC